MAMDYTSYVASLANLLAQQDPTQPEFVQILPSVIAYAEGRCYRDLDMLAAEVRDASQTTNAGSRTISLPSTAVTVIEGINIITPAGIVNPDDGTRVPLTMQTRDYVDWVWRSSSTTGVPQVVALINDTTAIVGPTPNGAYQIEVIGTSTPAPLSEENSTTPLTTYLPDLFMAASMVFATGGIQKNYGAQSSDPQMAVSWEQEYSKLLNSAAAWEFRKKFQAEGWTSAQPNPVARPARV
jgi:hypothetical protein